MPRPRFALSVCLGAVLAWWVGRVLGVRRAHVLTSLRRAGFQRAEQIAADMYRSLGTGVFELLALSLSSKRVYPVLGVSEAITRVARVQAQRRHGRNSTGVVVATAHSGNWDLVACGVALEIPLSVITKRLSVAWLNRWWQGLRARRGVRLLEAGAAAGLAARDLKQGRWVAMLIDQAPERSRGTTSAEFLGQMADLDLAPALLALRSRCPLLVVFPRRTAAGQHCIELGGVYDPPAGATRSWAVEVTLEANRCLEAFVRAHPDQWLWMHRRWKRGPRLSSRIQPGVRSARLHLGA